MKKYFLIPALLLLFFMAKPTHADVLPEGQVSVPVCNKLSNASGFPNYYYLSISILEASNGTPQIDLLEDNTCAKGYYKLATNKIFAVLKTDFATKDFSSIKDFNDERLIPSGVSLSSDFKYVNSPTDIAKVDMEYLVASMIPGKAIIYMREDKETYKDGTFLSKKYDINGNLAVEALPDHSFKDVTPTTEYSKAIGFLKDEGYATGYPDGTYQPQNEIQRVEFAKIVVNAFKGTTFANGCVNNNLKADAYVYFADVMKGLWYSDYVCAAKRENIIKGYDDGLFWPARSINLAEAYKIALTTKYGADKFNESTGTHWYDTYLNYAKANGLDVPNMTADKKFTRGEMAQVVFLIQTIPK